jgi:serine palmitoyltransferase
MSTWWGEWWTANGQPIVDAYSRSRNWGEVWLAMQKAPATYWRYIKTLYDRSPEHVIIETFLIVFIFYILFVKQSRPIKKDSLSLTEGEIQQLLDEWQPEPLVPEVPALTMETASYNLGVVEDTPGSHMKLKGVSSSVLNMGTLDFLGMSSRPEIKSVARAALTKYGCGSCGPRGFYGTIDTHEILEKDIANFLGTTDSIAFSDLEATSSSVLPAFAKRGDLVLVDEGCCDSILVGVNLARCTTIFYKHNDLGDLEVKMKNVRDADMKAGRRSNCQRRYVVTEGLFRNYGDIVPLPQLVALCRKYFFRLFVDESMSFGVLGATGKGVTEHFGLGIDVVDIMTGALCTSMASVGGFSTGSQHVVDYQRINSAGYVFSASAPPYTSAVASEAIRILKREPHLLMKLRANAEAAHTALSLVPGLIVLSAPFSPVVHVTMPPPTHVTSQRAGQEWVHATCQAAAATCLQKGVAVVAPRHKNSSSITDVPLPPPTVRLTLNALHTSEHVTVAVSTLVAALGLSNPHLNSRSPSPHPSLTRRRQEKRT